MSKVRNPVPVVQIRSTITRRKSPNSPINPTVGWRRQFEGREQQDAGAAN